MLDLLKTLTLTLVVGRGLWFSAATLCINNDINISTDTPLTKSMDYFQPEELLQQIIIPEMSFKCHGNITSWSALTAISQDQNTLIHLTFKLIFTVWRPRGGNVYDLIGQNEIEYEGMELISGITQIENSSDPNGYYRINEKEPEEQITFQPGDVVGWTIPRTIHSTSSQFSVVYEKVNSQNTRAVNLLFLKSNIKSTYCSVLQCDSLESKASVLPYISVQYVEGIRPDAGSTQTDLVCFKREQQCPATGPTLPTPTSDVTLFCSGFNCPSTESTNHVIYYIAAGSAAVVLVLLLLLCGIVSRMVYRRVFIKNTLQENPTYESADALFQLPIAGENNEHDIYSKPDGIVHSKISMPGGKFDGQCYASAYETNGNIHLYQELPEANPQTRCKSMNMSNEALDLKPHLPLRMAMSSASVSKSLFTMPNNNTALHSEANEKPSMNGTPYLIFQPSLSSTRSKSKALSYPNLDSRHSVISFLQTPDTTSPGSDSSDHPGYMTRKIFHAIDDEMFNVPNASERGDFKEMDSPDQIYSKLVHFQNQKSQHGVDTAPMGNMVPYWIPPSSTSELYDELAKKNYREIHRKYISTTEYIGGGYFGKVHKGCWKVPGGEMQVAIKTLNPESSGDNEFKFLKEAAIMGQFLHSNVVKLLGVVTVGEPLMIVLEFMPGGDLSHYLGKLRCQPGSISKNLPATLLNFCRQVGFGMNYLANKGFVHRDLAARNILVTDDKTCKIGDFGMARDLEEDQIYFSKGGKLPLKWTAPESLKFNHFSSASDVWSYGMLLFEIWALGKKPFEGMLTKRVIKLVHTGYCQPPPPGCPRPLYQLMVQCWHTVPEERCTFSNICSYLDSSLEESLLMWSSNDLNTLPQAAVLGAPLMESRKLYLDLQYTHSTL